MTDLQKRYDPIFDIAPSRPQAQRDSRMNTAMGAGKLFGPGAFFGAALTGGVGEAMGANPLSPDMDARVAAQEAAQKRIQSLNPAEWAELDSGQKSRYYRRVLGEEAFRNGLDGLGMQLFQQIQIESEEAQKRSADLEKVGIDTAAKYAETEQKIWGHNREKFKAVRGEGTMIYPRGVSDPNTGVYAFVDDYGIARTGDKEYALGSYTTDRPQRPPKAGSGRSGGGRNMIPNSEAAKLRAQQRDVAAQMRAGLRISNILGEAYGESGSIDIMGFAGKASGVATKIIDEVGALGRSLAKASGKKYTDKMVIEGSGDWRFGGDVVLDGTEENAMSVADRLVSDSYVPESLRKDELGSRRYKAALVNLTYAVARSEEPGNPRLSDDDFKRNLDQIASSTTSPETLRRVLIDRISTSREDFDMFTKQLSANLEDIISTDAFTEYQALSSEFDEVFGTPWGTAANPTGSLTDTPETPAASENRRRPRAVPVGDGFEFIISSGN